MYTHLARGTVIYTLNKSGLKIAHVHESKSWKRTLFLLVEKCYVLPVVIFMTKGTPTLSATLGITVHL